MDRLAVWSETGKPVSSWRHCGPTQQTQRNSTLTQCINQVIRWNMTTTTQQPFTALFLGSPGWASARREPLDFTVQGRINRGRHTPTDRPAGRHSIRTKQCPPPSFPHFFTGRMPFLLPNQQCQSTEGNVASCENAALILTDNNRNDKWNWLLFHLNRTLPWVLAVLELWRTAFIFENSYLQIQGGQLWVAQHGGWIQIGPMHVSQNTAKMTFIFKHNFNWVTH